MEVHVRDWDGGSGWLLNVETAQLREYDGKAENGWLFKVKDNRRPMDPRFLTVYSDGEALWFQADLKRWRLDQLTFMHESDSRGIACHFQVVRGGETVVDLCYSGPLADPINQSDPSFDALDEELLDFMLFMSINGSKERWRLDALNQWHEPR
jgi:hypothetical protein